nr:winged helix-turn-helix domain-containing protein [Mycoplasma leonicaptivi]
MQDDLNKTENVILYLIDLIATRKVPVNKIMPSEHALMARFNCSRSVVVAAYQRLSALGAIYSISKRGHFVAENFHNLIKPISLLIGADVQWGEEVPNTEPEWFETKNIIFVHGSRSFVKKYEKNGSVIAEADIWVSLKHIDQDEPIDTTKPLIDILDNKERLTNVVYELKWEKVNRLDHEYMMVITLFGYDLDSICIAAKYYIKPEHFTFWHQEFSLI